MREIRFMVIWLGTKCNLKCKQCGTLIPYLEDMEYDINKIIENINYITRKVRLANIQIQGGEPFLYEGLSTLLEKCAQNNQIGHITIASNATLMPNETCIDILRAYRDKIDVRYSTYRCVKKEYRQNIINKLIDNGVNANTYNFMFGNDKWYDSGIFQEYKADKESILKLYKECANRHCWTLADDWLVNCAKVLSLMVLLNRKDYSENNAVNVTEAREKNKDIEKILDEYDYRYLNDVPVMCGYCKGTGEMIDPAIQTTQKEIEEYRKIFRENMQ